MPFRIGPWEIALIIVIIIVVFATIGIGKLINRRAKDEASKRHTLKVTGKTSSIRSTSEVTMLFCSNCGSEVSTGWTYCRSCGKKLTIPKDRLITNEEVHNDVPKPEPEIQKNDYHSKNTSGQKHLAVVPTEIKGWSWGAFLLWWIWGIGNNTYISFLTLIPYVGQIVMPFVLGAKGNEWAWKNKHWESIAHFKDVQFKWTKAGYIVVIASLAIWGISALVLSL